MKRASTRQRAGNLLSFVVAMTVPSVLWVASSSACIPQPIVVVTPSNSGRAGSKVTLEGLRFAQGPVEARWGDLDGQLLGQGTGPNFTTDFTVPNASPGVYSIIVLSRAADGSVGTAVQSTTFQVTAPDAQPALPAPHPADTKVRGGFGAIRLAGPAIALAVGALAFVRLSRRKTRRGPQAVSGSATV